MNGFVVVDASLAFKWLVSEENSDRAQALSRSWVNDGIQATAPYLMPVEVANALHRRVTRGELAVSDAVRLLEHLLASGIELRNEQDLHVAVPVPISARDANQRITNYLAQMSTEQPTR